GAGGVPRDAEQLRTGRLAGADGGERRAAFEGDVEDVDQCFNIVDGGRLAEETRLHRERRLVARLAAFPFDRIEQGGLLAADVGAGAATDLDVEAQPLPQDVVAEEAAGPGLRGGAVKTLDQIGRAHV